MELLPFGSFSHHPQSVLAGIQPFTFVFPELFANLGPNCQTARRVAPELCAAILTDAVIVNESQLVEVSLCHAHSFPQAGPDC